MLRNSAPYRSRQIRRDPRKIGRLSVLAVAGLLCLATVGYLAYRMLCQSSFCAITDVNIVGAERVAQKEIMELCAIGLQDNLLTLSPERIRSQVESHPWIERADITRQWPNRLLVRIRERQPVAIANVEGKLYYVDAAGVIFAEIDKKAALDYPVISGSGGAALDSREPSESLSSALKFLSYVRKNDTVLPRQNVSEINIRSNGEMVVFLADRPFPIYLGTEGLERSYYRLVKVLYWLYKKKEFDVTGYIRLDYGPEKVLVGRTG